MDGLLGPLISDGPEVYTQASLRSETTWSFIIPLVSFMTGAIVMQCWSYIRTNPLEPRRSHILACLITLIVVVQTVLEALGNYFERRAAVQGTFSISVFIPWFAATSCILTACAGLLVHGFFARIVYRMFRTVWARAFWVAYTLVFMSAVAAGGLGTGVLYAKLSNSTLIGLLKPDMFEIVNTDLDMHVMWAVSSTVFDLTLSSIMVWKLLKSVSAFGFDTTNSKLVSLAVSILETLALPTMASATICGVAIAIRTRTFIAAPKLALVDISLVLVNSRLYAISLVYTLNRQAIARRELERPAPGACFHLQDVLSQAGHHSSDLSMHGRMPTQVMVHTETVIHVDVPQAMEDVKLSKTRSRGAGQILPSTAPGLSQGVLAVRGLEPILGYQPRARPVRAPSVPESVAGSQLRRTTLDRSSRSAI